MNPDQESYEAETPLCEVCGEPFTRHPADTGDSICSGCADWSDIEGYCY